MLPCIRHYPFRYCSSGYMWCSIPFLYFFDYFKSVINLLFCSCDLCCPSIYECSNDTVPFSCALCILKKCAAYAVLPLFRRHCCKAPCYRSLASATTGRTVARALECIQYYGGMISGVSAIFSASDKVEGVEINHIFSAEDIENYQTFESSKCPMCARGEKIDAIVNSFGYSRL